MSAPDEGREAMNEARFKVGDQWFYRGNRSPSWFFVASRADGSCQGGISERVPVAWWPMLEEIASLRSATPASASSERAVALLQALLPVAEETCKRWPNDDCFLIPTENARAFLAALPSAPKEKR